MSEPVVSVLMTVFNAGRFLDPSIRSILDQTFRDFEFLIIDDASTDGSAEIAEAWADQDRERLQELGIDASEYRRAEDHRDLVRAAADSMFASWWRLAFGGLDGSRAQRSDG